MSYYPFVTITFEQTGRPYTYRNHIEDLSVGNCVVVELPNGYALGRVKDLLVDDLRGIAVNWIVDRVTFDTTKYDALTALSPSPPPEKLSSAQNAIRNYRNYVKLTPI